MSSHEPFTLHEAVILLDAYLEIISASTPKGDVIKRVSSDLRKMAVNEGKTIDESYRNANGIFFQMKSMEAAFTKSKTIVSPTKLFAETVSLYHNNRSEYNRILEEARHMISEDNVAESNEKQFYEWLSKQVSPTKLSELYFCYPAIDDFCVKTHVLKKPLFETLDLETVKKAQKTVNENRAFRFAYRKKMGLIISAIQYYVTYVRELEYDSKKASVVNLKKETGEVELPVIGNQFASTGSVNHELSNARNE